MVAALVQYLTYSEYLPSISVYYSDFGAGVAPGEDGGLHVSPGNDNGFGIGK
jgi:hypothetical protein